MTPNLEEIRKEGLISGEKRYLAVETLRAVVEWFRETKPSVLLDKDQNDDITTRALWAKWTEALTKTVFEKGEQLPELLMDDVIGLFRGNGNANTQRTSEVREEVTGEK